MKKRKVKQKGSTFLRSQNQQQVEPECELGHVAPTIGQHCPQPDDLTCQKGGCTSPLHSCQWLRVVHWKETEAFTSRSCYCEVSPWWTLPLWRVQWFEATVWPQSVGLNANYSNPKKRSESLLLTDVVPEKVFHRFSVWTKSKISIWLNFCWILSRDYKHSTLKWYVQLLLANYKSRF